LVERDPWLMVIGSDSPSFAMYSDGTVIYRGSDGRTLSEVHLTAEARQSFLESLRLKELDELEATYKVSDWTDQPTNELFRWVAGRRTAISVYGPLRKDDQARGKAPRAYLKVFDAITHFDPEGARPWQPPTVEVLIWPYEYSPETPLPWPSHWPSFEQAVARGASGLHQIILPGRELSSVERLISNLREKQAILLADRKWAIAFRLPFPSEERWTN
jgi:hypothetical protein